MLESSRSFTLKRWELLEDGVYHIERRRTRSHLQVPQELYDSRGLDISPCYSSVGFSTLGISTLNRGPSITDRSRIKEALARVNNPSSWTLEARLQEGEACLPPKCTPFIFCKSPIVSSKLLHVATISCLLAG